MIRVGIRHDIMADGVDDVARALMDELVRHYHGASDTLALRRDYDWARGRYDKAVDALTQLACRPQELHIRKAEE